jgi:hypothetical protein
VARLGFAREEGAAVIECPKCGYRNSDGTEFCQNPGGCGAFLGYELK